jgi:hypothetical protein
LLPPEVLFGLLKPENDSPLYVTLPLSVLLASLVVAILGVLFYKFQDNRVSVSTARPDSGEQDIARYTITSIVWNAGEIRIIMETIAVGR